MIILTLLFVAGDQILVEVPHGLPLLVMQQHVGSGLLHPQHGLLRTPLRMLRHQVTTHQGRAPNDPKISIKYKQSLNNCKECIAIRSQGRFGA